MSIRTKRLRLAVVVHSLKPGGGVANVARAQLKHLAEYFDVELVYAEGEFQQAGVQTHKVATPNFSWLRRFGHVVKEWRTCKRFSKQLLLINGQRKIDFILFHSHTAASLCDKTLLKSSRHGVVIHGDIFSRPAGTYDPLLTRLYRWASKRAYASADLVVALSPAMSDAAIRAGASHTAVELIPNGLSEHWTQARSDKVKGQAEELKLLMVGRLSADKDPLTLIKAFGLVQQHYRLSNVVLNIAGTGPLLKDCQTLIKELEIDENVSLIGSVKSEEMLKLYGDHDVLCITSISDPLPTVVLEAMSQKLAVIGANTDGIPFMVQHDKTGLIVNSATPHELAESIAQLNADRERLRAFGHQGRLEVEERFTSAKSAKLLAHKIKNA